MIRLRKQPLVQQRSQPERADSKGSRLPEEVPTSHLKQVGHRYSLVNASSRFSSTLASNVQAASSPEASRSFASHVNNRSISSPLGARAVAKRNPCRTRAESDGP